MTPEERRTAVALARQFMAEAVAKAGQALHQVEQAVGAGHDATVATHDARRACEVAGAKLEILARRTP